MKQKAIILFSLIHRCDLDGPDYVLYLKIDGKHYPYCLTSAPESTQAPNIDEDSDEGISISSTLPTENRQEKPRALVEGSQMHS